MAVANSIELVRKVLRGYQPAVDFFMVLGTIAHFWDDLIDKDRQVSDEEINGVMWNALVTLPNNEFYRQFFDALNPLLVTAIANWQTATAFERGDNPRQHQIAFITRSDYANILIQAAYLVGGREWMLQMTPVIRDEWTDEDYATYADNLKKERAAREGEAHGDV
jgi:hypothetical protein